jgi:hypothetical protein
MRKRSTYAQARAHCESCLAAASSELGFVLLHPSWAGLAAPDGIEQRLSGRGLARQTLIVAGN